jgi:heptosyltransferase II
MKILIELPTWLGDTVMSTPAIENIFNFFDDSCVTLIGSFVAIETLKNHPRVDKTYVIEKQYFKLYRSLKNLGDFDIFFSFRSSFRSKVLKLFLSSNKKYQFNKSMFSESHQVEKYNNFVNNCLQTKILPSKLILHKNKESKKEINKILGLNPGASYGSSKRWYPEEFAKVAINLSNEYDIIIFGGSEEKNIAKDIEQYLIDENVINYQNLASKTSIPELISLISNLDLFVTGDSGPMHIAAAFSIPTIAIFGPTNSLETSQWMNNNYSVIKKNLNCQPCMKRVCPLHHHQCMKNIKAKEVLIEIEKLT